MKQKINGNCAYFRASDRCDRLLCRGEQQGNENGGEKTLADIGIISDVENTPTMGRNDDYSYADGVPDSEYVLDGPLTERMIVLSELTTGNQVRLAEAMKKAAVEGNHRGLYRRLHHRGRQRG